MLLAFLGIEGERIDIGAHVAGLFSGAAIGLVVRSVGPVHSGNARVQSAAAGAVAFLFVGSWLLALAIV
jgi:hypothetical protein